MIALFLSFAAYAQSFEAPLEALMGPDGIAVLADGTELRGKPVIVPKGVGNIKVLTLKFEDGTKRKLMPADLKSFALKPNKLAKLASTNTSIVGMASGENEEILNKDYVYFLPAPLPNGKLALLQHLNPRFPGPFQVFADPADRETGGVAVGGIQVSGGMLKSYLLYKQGAEASMLVKKGTYDKLWPEIYGDCAAMAKPEKAEFDTLAADLIAYAEACEG